MIKLVSTAAFVALIAISTATPHSLRAMPRYIVPRLFTSSHESRMPSAPISSLPASRSAQTYTMSLICDDTCDFFINGEKIATANWSAYVTGKVTLKLGDVMAWTAADTKGGHNGVAFTIVDSSGKTYLSHTIVNLRAIQAKSYSGTPDTWKTAAFDSCHWPSAVPGTQSCLSNDGMYCTDPDSPLTQGAQTVWAEGEQLYTTVYIRYIVGGACSPCQCFEGEGCDNDYCTNCLMVFVDPAGDTRKACYSGWTAEQCLSAGSEYFWCSGV